MSLARPYAVATTLAGEDESTLLRIIMALHRRGVYVVEAVLAQLTTGGCSFSATFMATEGQARVVAASLQNLVEVVGVELREAARPGRPAGQHLEVR